MTNTPLVSIILPTHNGARFIRRAIESLRQQHFTDWELIVINDGSTDATGSLITEIAAIEPRIRVVHATQNQGIQKSLNEGILQARGEYIARIDDDDVWSDATKLQKQVSFLQAHPECLLVGTGIIVQNEAGDELYRFLNPETDASIRRRLLYRNCFSHSSVVFRKAAALRFNGYSEAPEVTHLEDYDLWLKLGTIGQLANLPEYLVRYTVHRGAISQQHKVTQLRRQLDIAQRFRAQYPRYRFLRLLGWLRLWGYQLFGALLPQRLVRSAISMYKRS